MRHAERREPVYLRGGLGENFNVPPAVDALYYGAQLVLNAAVKTVCKAEITGLLTQLYDGLGKLRAARAALREQANEAMADTIRGLAADTLDKVLYELSCQMKNCYSRSDA